jgi:diguanylate cyclase (GGDEF)-like protein
MLVAGGAVVGVAATVPLLCRLRARLSQVQHRASHDPLTGLWNRAGLREQYAGWRRPLVLLLVDIDGFKAVNDTFGHPLGDALLTGFATRLATAAADLGGVAGRLGGDEFVVLVAAGGAVETARISEDMLAVLSPAPTTAADHGLAASAGIAVITAGVDWSEALRRADIALYHAKHTHARLVVYQPGMVHPRSAPVPAVDRPSEHAS